MDEERRVSCELYAAAAAAAGEDQRPGAAGGAEEEEGNTTDSIKADSASTRAASGQRQCQQPPHQLIRLDPGAREFTPAVQPGPVTWALPYQPPLDAWASPCSPDVVNLEAAAPGGAPGGAPLPHYQLARPSFQLAPLIGFHRVPPAMAGPPPSAPPSQFTDEFLDPVAPPPPPPLLPPRPPLLATPQAYPPLNLFPAPPPAPATAAPPPPAFHYRDHLSRAVQLIGVPAGLADQDLAREMEAWGDVRAVQVEPETSGSSPLITVHYFDLRSAMAAVTDIQAQHILQQQRMQRHLFQAWSNIKGHQQQQQFREEEDLLEGERQQKEHNINIKADDYKEKAVGNVAIEERAAVERQQVMSDSVQGNADALSILPITNIPSCLYNASDDDHAVSCSASASASTSNRGLIGGKPVWAQYTVPVGLRASDAHNQGTLVVFNLDSDAEGDMVRSIFERYGAVKEVREAPSKKRHKFVEFFDIRDAAAAMAALSGEDIGGSKVKIEFSRPGGHPRRPKMRQALVTNPPEVIRNVRDHSVVTDHQELDTSATAANIQSQLWHQMQPNMILPDQFGNFNNSINNIIYEGAPPGYNMQSFAVVNWPGQDQMEGPYVGPGSTWTTDVLYDMQWSHTNIWPTHQPMQPPGGGLHDVAAIHWQMHATSLQELPHQVQAGAAAAGCSNFHMLNAQDGNAGLQRDMEESRMMIMMQRSSLMRERSGDQRSNTRAGRGGVAGRVRAPNSIAPVRPNNVLRSSSTVIACERALRGTTNASQADHGPTNLSRSSRKSKAALIQQYPTAGSQWRASSRFNGRKDQLAALQQFDSSCDSPTYRFDPAEAESADRNGRTTLMIRNIPNKYTQKMFLDLLDQHCFDCNNSQPSPDQPSAYDFAYLPIDFKNRCNLGYAFVNFTTPIATLRFHKIFNNLHWRDFNSRKVCEVTYARLQGRAALEEHFKNSRFACDTDEYLPLVFSPPRMGRRNSFSGSYSASLDVVPTCSTYSTSVGGEEDEDDDQDRQSAGIKAAGDEATAMSSAPVESTITAILEDNRTSSPDKGEVKEPGGVAIVDTLPSGTVSAGSNDIASSSSPTGEYCDPASCDSVGVALGRRLHSLHRYRGILQLHSPPPHTHHGRKAT